MANMPGFEEACELACCHQLFGQDRSAPQLDGGKTSVYSLLGPCHCSAMNSGCSVRGELCSTSQRRNGTPSKQSSRHKFRRVWIVEFIRHISILISTSTQSGRLVRLPSALHASIGIGAIRLTRNCGAGIRLGHKLYKAAYNARLQMHGLAKTRYFGSAKDVATVLATTRDDIEVMVHVTDADPDNLLDRDDAIGSWSPREQLTSYA